jgi:ABC-2 type transport system permease protein
VCWRESYIWRASASFVGVILGGRPPLRPRARAEASPGVLKLLGDRTRLVFGLIFPLFIIGVLGGTMQANLGQAAGYDFVPFVFTGIYAQTLFQSTVQGIISLIADRQNDFSQEMFVSPISRFSIVFGKILGESSVAMLQAIPILVLGILVGIRPSVDQVLGLLIVGVAVCLFGGAFGVLTLSNLKDQRSVSQIVPFVMLPQFFLSGAFVPVKVLSASARGPLSHITDALRGGPHARQLLRQSARIRARGP